MGNFSKHKNRYLIHVATSSGGVTVHLRNTIFEIFFVNQIQAQVFLAFAELHTFNIKSDGTASHAVVLGEWHEFSKPTESICVRANETEMVF